MNLKKTMLSSLSIALVMSLSSVSVFADSSEDVLNPVISPSSQGEAIVIPGSSSLNVDSIVTPFAEVSFSYSKLQPYSETESSVVSGQFHLTSSGSVVLKVVQYPSTSGDDTAYVRYILRASELNSQTLYGNYTGTNATIIWNQVPAGTYRIEVQNLGADPISGNGYVQ